MDEYKKFNWRLGGIGKEYEKIQKARKDEEFNKLLYRAFTTKEKKQPCIVSKDYFGEKVFILRMKKWTISFCRERKRAKIFEFSEDAMAAISRINAPKNLFQVEAL